MLIAYWFVLMHICSAIMDIGPAPRPKAQGPRSCRSSRPLPISSLGLGPWGLGAGPISSVAEHGIFCALRAVSGQYKL